MTKSNRGIFVGAIVALSVLFLGSQSVFGLSEEQSSAISQDCSSIKQNLYSLQKADSKTRSYLGAIYKTFLTNFINPLNLSLVKNNRPSTTITQLYADILSVRESFGDSFKVYSQAFEELLKIECKEKPNDFYDKLEGVRDKRAELNGDVKKLRALLKDYYVETTKLKEGI